MRPVWGFAAPFLCSACQLVGSIGGISYSAETPVIRPDASETRDAREMGTSDARDAHRARDAAEESGSDSDLDARHRNDSAEAAPDDAGIDAGIDAGGSPSVCPTSKCAAADTCCATNPDAGPSCLATCEAADTLHCLGPADCSGDTPTCCLFYVATVVSTSVCPSTAVRSACTALADCPVDEAETCVANPTDSLCASSADCPSGDVCCGGMVSFLGTNRVCFPAALAAEYLLPCN